MANGYSSPPPAFTSGSDVAPSKDDWGGAVARSWNDRGGMALPGMLLPKGAGKVSPPPHPPANSPGHDSSFREGIEWQRGAMFLPSAGAKHSFKRCSNWFITLQQTICPF